MSAFGGKVDIPRAPEMSRNHCCLKYSCAFQSEVIIHPLETPIKPPAITSLRKWYALTETKRTPVRHERN